MFCATNSFHLRLFVFLQQKYLNPESLETCEPTHRGPDLLHPEEKPTDSRLTMSSRRKSTTPCMVLPADAAEEKTQRTEEEVEEVEEVEEEEEGKEGAEELDQAVLVVPTPPDTGV